MMTNSGIVTQFDYNSSIIVVDVMNIVAYIKGGKKSYIFRRLEVINRELSNFSNMYYFYPNYLTKRIDEKDKFQQFLKERKDQIIKIPIRNDIDNDQWMLDFARQKNAFILTNDKFRQYAIKDVKNRLLPFKFHTIKNELIVMLPWRI